MADSAGSDDGGGLPDVWQQAIQQYPILQRQGLAGVMNIGGGQGYMESWQPGEPGSQDYPRPSTIPLNQPGIEIYRTDAQPIDVLADAASHFMVNSDPAMRSYYSQFQNMAQHNHTQQQMLQQQYQHALQNEGESRPYDQWLNMTGMPAWFRGRAFEQWPSDFTDKTYSDPQKQLISAVQKYVGYTPTKHKQD